MRILIAVGQDKVISGGAIQALQLARELQGRGHFVRVVFITPRDEYASARFSQLRQEGMRISLLPMRGFRMPCAALGLRRLMAEDRTEIVYAVKGRALTAALLATPATRVPIVAHRGVNHAFDAFSRIRYHHHRVRAIVAVSQSTRDLIAGSSPRLGRKTEVVYQAADDRHFNPSDPERLRREFGIRPDTPVVAVVGNILPRKGHRVFLQSIPQILKEFPDARFIFIGGGSSDELLGTLDAAAAGSIIFAGFRNDVHELLPGVTVSVNPAVEGEGLTGTTRESLAAGVPVVVTDVAGTKELIEDGISGCIVPREDPQAISDAVCRLLRDRGMRLEMGEAGRARVKAIASSGVRVAAMERVFRRAIAGYTPHSG